MSVRRKGTAGPIFGNQSRIPTLRTLILDLKQLHIM